MQRQPVLTRLSREERTLLATLAKREGRTISQMLRQLVTEKAEREGIVLVVEAANVASQVG